MNEEVKVTFNIKGNRWEREGKVNYFTNLDAWKIERTSSMVKNQGPAPQPKLEDMPPDIDDLSDLPF